MTHNNSTNIQTEVPAKPRTIIRMISSKFAPRPQPELSREQRDAALRARGLLPQQPPRPLPPEPRLEPGVPSAADTIKQEWAAKNERERFHSFKFGGPSIQVPPEKQLPSPPSSPVLNNSVVPSKTYSPPLRALPTPPDTPLFGVPTGPSVTQHPSPPTLSSATPLTNSNATTESKPHNDALHRHMDSFAQLEASLSSIVTMQTDSSSQVLTPAVSVPSLTTVSGSPKSKAPKVGPRNPHGLQLKAHNGPSIPILVESPVDLDFSESPVVVVDESASKTLASQEVVVVVKDKEDKDGIRDIPLVPVRKVVSTASTAAAPRSPQRSLITSAPKSPADTPLTTSSKPKRGMTDPTPVADGKRKITNPFRRGEHKSAAVDDTAVGVVIGDETPKAQLRPRRLTMGSSFSNLRRSFVGTLSRPSNSDHKNSRKFDASHLPPSPTIPSSFNISPPGFSFNATRSRSRGGSGGSSNTGEKLGVPPPSPRVCQNIAMHNPGTIQSETAAIEDDEIRRMTELAYS